MGETYLPNFPIPEGMKIDEFLKIRSRKRTQTKACRSITKPQKAIDKKIYFDRLNFEVDVINQMGYAGYFLIVSDFINWSKQNNIPVGPW